MSQFTPRVAIAVPAARSVAFAALLGATLFAGPLAAATNDSTTATPAPGYHHVAFAGETKGETLEQRIHSLHRALKITADEDAAWTPVAQAMRDNAAAMQKLVAERVARAPHSASAVDDLTSYETFAQAHVDGLKNLITAFGSLYDTMPDSQKKVADHVFESFGRPHAHSHS
jgi:hypothetical protein